MPTSVLPASPRSPSIHGHVIMQWLSAAAGPVSFDELLFRVTSEFGSRASFRTCDAESLSLPALLALLEKRGKVWRDGGGYRSSTSRMCDDGEDHAHRHADVVRPALA